MSTAFKKLYRTLGVELLEERQLLDVKPTSFLAAMPALTSVQQTLAIQPMKVDYTIPQLTNGEVLQRFRPPSAAEATASRVSLDKTKYPAERATLLSSSLQRSFPKLGSNFEVTAPSTPGMYNKPGVYNCIGWSLGLKEYKWPKDKFGRDIQSAKVADFDKLNAQYGYRRMTTMDLSLQRGVEKIVLYAKNGSATHQARQLSDGTWTSKLGRGAQIRHLTAAAVGGGDYGNPIAVYFRYK